MRVRRVTHHGGSLTNVIYSTHGSSPPVSWKEGAGDIFIKSRPKNYSVTFHLPNGAPNFKGLAPFTPNRGLVVAWVGQPPFLIRLRLCLPNCIRSNFFS